MNVAYVRVSTEDQNESRQIEGLEKHGIEKWYVEKISGKDTNRPKLREMLEYVRDGDTVFIHDFSRLARSTKDLLGIVECLNKKGVNLVSNKENLDTSTPTGKLMLTMIGAINEFERQNLLERQREGIAIAKRAHRFKGGKVKQIDQATFDSAYEKYSRRDVCLLMNVGKDLSSTMYGMKRINDDVFIFVTYHKEESTDKTYVDGKPDYADSFEDNMIFRWDSQIGKGVNSTYVRDVSTAPRKHLFVKKSDAESNFYYVGQFDVIDVKAAYKKDNRGRNKDLAKFRMKMRVPVREDLLRYLQSNISKQEELIS